MRQPSKHNEVPDGDYFRGVFDFSKMDLLTYIKENHLTEPLLGKSYDQRCTPSAFMEEVSEGYCVGWFDGSQKELRLHTSIENAATDFVLRFWDMPRD